MQPLECLDQGEPDDVCAERASHDTHAQETARRLSDEVVRRFVLDPAAFARAADAEPAALVRAYRDSVDRRLAPLRAARPAAAAGAAFLAPATFGGDPADMATREDGAVRMGAVVALALGSMVIVAAAVTLLSTILARLKPL